ncbi:E3 ubiquitin-protein ligase UPL5-like [Rutidosis leptorrhynchoides]|uniref:E3 ubiquitin-protein ligase UPL5-like n=1 Tax=Rutidosis leptorrhynchoides TaxID=125765 RepID=UPI003A997517
MSSPSSPTTPMKRRKLDDHDSNFNPNSPIHHSPRVSTSQDTSPDHPNRIQFFVRLISDAKTLVLHGNSNDQVKSIHEKLQSITGIPVTEHRLIYGGRQLQDESTLAECKITKDATLHLVARMRSTEHPEIWHIVNEFVSMIYRLCKGETNICLDLVKWKVEKFYQMTCENNISDDKLVSYLNIFQALYGSKALVMLYVSSDRGNKKCAESLVRNFIDSIITKLGQTLYYYCAPVVLDLCNVLGESVGQDDQLYRFCRTNLGLIVENVKRLVRRSKNNDDDDDDDKSCIITVEDVFPFVTELANDLSGSLSFKNGNPSSIIVHDFATFLQPIKVAVKDVLGHREFIKLPLVKTLRYYDDEIRQLFMILFDLLGKVRNRLKEIEGQLLMKNKQDNGWDQYLPLLKELGGISKLFQDAEGIFWGDMKFVKVVINYLIVTYAEKGEDYEWICGRNDILDSQSRSHLAMMLLPEIDEEFDESHEMLIDRSNLLAESFEYIADKQPEDLRAGLFMAFKNEEATGPGVLREWFYLVCQELFNPNFSLFVACPNDPRRFFPNPACKMDFLKRLYFKFAGRVIALSLMHKLQVGITLDRSFFVQLVGANVSLEDIKDADPYLYNSCKKILEMDPIVVDQDVLGLTFVHEIEEFGFKKTIELFPNGKNVVVNSRNRKEYVELLIKHRFEKSVKVQVAQFVRGFADIIGYEKGQKLFFKFLELEDLDGLLNGNESNICVEDWKLHTEYSGYKETDPQICWFWKIVGEMTDKQRSILLFFWTAMKHPPVDGFSGLSSKLFIYKTNDSINLLPSSHTCFSRLCFPAYPSIDVMRERLNIITQDHVFCSFGLS